MRKFIIHIFKRHEWEIVEKKYGSIDMEAPWGKDNDLDSDIFGVARVVDGKLVELVDPFPVRKDELERFKKDPRFQEKVEFECYVVTEEDKRPFKVKERFTGPLWKGLKYVNENLGL